MGFPNDLVLMAESDREAIELIEELKEIAKKAGLTIFQGSRRLKK